MISVTEAAVLYRNFTDRVMLLAVLTRLRNNYCFVVFALVLAPQRKTIKHLNWAKREDVSPL